ncbi:Piwi domain-containing protein [Sphaerosporella brunnea]|uniref:Piwi domain-containing protein n=1 Tax=Sphaerosporella brunnea TaxID=1250544 RepID=A0A5J5EKN2_9PEZI|nr:Piwi domain-containing protein [Sphaerosporella brunnea]
MSSMQLSAVTAAGEPTMPRRPGYGTVGRQTWVRANFFPVDLPKDAVFMYDVKVDPEVKNKRKRRRLYDILENHEAFASISKHTATDYGKIIVSTKCLNPQAPPTRDGEKADRVEVTVVYTDTDDSPPPAEGKNLYKFIISRTTLIQPSDFEDYVAGKNPNYSPAQAIQAMNIILAKFPSKSISMVPVGRNKFFVLSDDNQLRFDLGAGLIALKGFYTSIRPSVGNVLCNLNVCTTAFYEPILVSASILKLVGNPPFHFNAIKRLKTHFRHIRVEFNYLKDKKTGKTFPRQRSINGLSQLTPAEIWFDEDDPVRGTKKKTNVETYFREKHGIRLQHPNLPAINVGAAQPVWIPPEVAKIVPGQYYTGKLPDEQTGRMILFACKQPKENAEAIENVGLPRLGLKGQNAHMDPFKMAVSTDMMVVSARILQAPPISYGNGPLTPTDASWNLMRKKFQRGATMNSWTYMIIEENRPMNVNEVINVVQMFQKTCREYGMNVQPPTLKFKDGSLPLVVRLPRERTMKELENAMKPAFKKCMDNNIQIVYVFLPSQDKAVYAAVKYCGDSKAGIGTVCSQWIKVSKERGQPQYLANVALKFNIKMGGTNHILQPAQLGDLKGGTTMIVGCDVTHPSPGSLKGTPSIAGVVASYDAVFSQYPASLRLQKTKQEMIDEMKEMMMERLKLWNRKNGGRYPQKIIVYRDGVSEGQFHQVLEKELPQIRAACTELRFDPKITIIIVGKRHHTRFYPTDDSAADGRTGNPQPGTVVDRGVTAIYDFDFYLQAHAGIKGTARPAHYYVIHDQNKFSADGLQTLTHNLCYLFGRATKSVSICPPAYYADLVCERGRCYIHGLLAAGDDSASSVSGQSEAQIIAANDRRAREIWGNGVNVKLQETMFYL